MRDIDMRTSTPMKVIYFGIMVILAMALTGCFKSTDVKAVENPGSFRSLEMFYADKTITELSVSVTIKRDGEKSVIVTEQKERNGVKQQ